MTREATRTSQGETLAPGLMVDLYHLDSAYVSWRSGQNGATTFDLYTRSHPFDSGFLLVAGLKLALDFAEAFHYSDDDLAFIRSVRSYDEAFLEELRRTRFSGRPTEQFGSPELG